MTKTLPDLPVHLWLSEQRGSSLAEIRAFSIRRAALLSGLAGVIKDDSNALLMAHEGTSDAKPNRP
jgi:hypothetical protein